MTDPENLHPLEQWLHDVADGVAGSLSSLSSLPSSRPPAASDGSVTDAFDDDPWADVTIDVVVLSDEQQAFLTSVSELPDIKSGRSWKRRDDA